MNLAYEQVVRLLVHLVPLNSSNLLQAIVPLDNIHYSVVNNVL